MIKETKIIAKISEGLGNQLFMYANSFSLSKKYNLDFYIDNLSGYYHKKKIYEFELDKFNISSKYAPINYTFANPYRNLLKKLNIMFAILDNKKKFIFENKDINKKTHYQPITINDSKDIFFLDGNFEFEKYFSDYRNLILKEFQIANSDSFFQNKYLKLIQSKNVISICVRQNRYSERNTKNITSTNLEKSNLFLRESIDYIYRGINYFKNKIDNPLFLIWSNDFSNLDNFFSTDDFIFVKNNFDKIITDFFLLTQCKYFIVAPSTFHWWGAWLSDFKDKICIRPKNLNASNNSDFWPESWHPI